MADGTLAQARFAGLVHALAGRGVTHGSGRRGFGSNALQVDGHIFAMLSRGRLVIRLPRERAAALLASGDGAAFDAGTGTPLPEWVVLESRADERWLPLAREARVFAAMRVASKAGAGRSRRRG